MTEDLDRFWRDQQRQNNEAAARGAGEAGGGVVAYPTHILAALEEVLEVSEQVLDCR